MNARALGAAAARATAKIDGLIRELRRRKEKGEEGGEKRKVWGGG